MKALTLTDFINDQKKASKTFAELYAYEEIANNIAVMIVEARKKAHLTQSGLVKKTGTLKDKAFTYDMYKRQVLE